MVVPEKLSPVCGKPHKGLQEAVRMAKGALEALLEREVETLAIAYSGEERTPQPQPS
jgi:predicted RNase H-like HicB family nuclease